MEKRFAFYDQIHTTGTDIKHVVNATAVITLGKDMVFRDYGKSELCSNIFVALFTEDFTYCLFILLPSHINVWSDFVMYTKSKELIA